MFFHANRRRRSLARDRLDGRELTTALDQATRWLVTFANPARGATPGFWQTVDDRMTLLHPGRGYSIYRAKPMTVGSRSMRDPGAVGVGPNHAVERPGG